jgi:hypothetical protein
VASPGCTYDYAKPPRVFDDRPRNNFFCIRLSGQSYRDHERERHHDGLPGYRLQRGHHRGGGAATSTKQIFLNGTPVASIEKTASSTVTRYTSTLIKMDPLVLKKADPPVGQPGQLADR